jgi:hypothetical protein
MSTLSDLEARITQLEALLAKHAATPTTLEGDEPTRAAESADPPTSVLNVRGTDRPDRRTDRRGVLKHAGVVAVGAIAGGTALALTQAQPAAALNGDPVLAGNLNLFNNQTTLGVGGGGNLSSGVKPAALMITDGTQTADGNKYGLAVIAENAVYPSGVYVRTAGRGMTIDAGAYGLVVAGNWATMALGPRGAAPPDTTLPYAAGMLHVDGSGTMWYCIEAGAPGVWRKLSGPGMAGALTVLPSPVRCYDSRAGYAPTGVVKGKLLNGQERTVDARVGGGVPAGASAALINLTVTGTNGDGWLACFQAGTAWSGTSNLNFTSGQTIANAVTVALDASGHLTVREAGPGTDFLVDVMGYFR